MIIISYFTNLTWESHEPSGNHIYTFLMIIISLPICLKEATKPLAIRCKFLDDQWLCVPPDFFPRGRGIKLPFIQCLWLQIRSVVRVAGYLKRCIRYNTWKTKLWLFFSIGTLHQPVSSDPKAFCRIIFTIKKIENQSDNEKPLLINSKKSEFGPIGLLWNWNLVFTLMYNLVKK